MFRHALKRGLQLTGAAAAGSAGYAYAVYLRERSVIPEGAELIRAAKEPAAPTTTLKRLSADNLMGGFDAYYLAATWFFESSLDAAALKKTLSAAVEKMPALAGRRSEGGIELSNAGARFSVCEHKAGSARDWIGNGSHVEPPRGDFADVPSTCTGGEQPLFTVRVTNFEDGTSALGIASPHSLMDGKSLFQVVSAIAAAHANGGRFDDKGKRTPPLPSFDSAAVWEKHAGALDARAAKEPLLPVSFWFLERTMPLWALGMKRLDWLLPRAKVSLSGEELAELKASVNAALAKAGQGGRRSEGLCTTNEALSAAFLRAVSTTADPFEEGAKAGTVRMVVNVQGKGLFKEVGGNVVGNFSWMVDEQTPKPPREMSIIEAASFFRALGDKWRDEASSEKVVEEMALFFRVQDVTGYLWGKTDDVANTLFLNNQSSTPMAHITFGAGNAIGYHPWHSHQHLQMVAAPKRHQGERAREGGMDVYLPMSYSPLLGTAQFKDDLLHGWQGGQK